MKGRADWLLTGGRHDTGACTSQDSKAKLCLLGGDGFRVEPEIGEQNERLWTLLGRLPRYGNSLQRDGNPVGRTRVGLHGYQDSRPKVCRY